MRDKPRPGKRRLSVLLVSAAAVAVLAFTLIYFLKQGERGTARVVVATNTVEMWPDCPVRRGDARGFNVLLVTLDTTRADRLGCYGYGGAETPNIDAVAARGVRFDDAVTSVPLTLPSHATMLTGLSPLDHGVHDNGSYALDENHTTLAEALLSRGYATAAFVSCFVLDRRFGLSQGFDTYDFSVTAEGYRPTMPDFNERSAAAVTDAAVGWLRSRAESDDTRPFFAWVHYFDPHQPYRSPLQHLTRFAARPYDAEIAYVDLELGRLFGEIEDLGEADSTLILIAGDHGEALGEHEEPTHGMLLYEPTMRVPLIVSCASLFDRPYEVSDRVVGLVDIRQTVDDLLGIEDDVSSLDGHSLFAANGDADRAIYMETEMPFDLAGWSPLRGLRTHANKYVLAPTPEMYDLARDPAELENLYSSDDPTASGLAALLGDILRRGEADERPRRELTDEELERLGSLGYLGSRPAVTGQALADPKSMMDVYNDAIMCEQLYARGEYEKSAALAESVMERGGALLQAVRVAAFSYMKLGRTGEAVALLRDAADSNPNPFLVRSLAQVLILDEQYSAALDVLDVYRSISPDDGRVHLLRGDVFDRLGQEDRAVDEYEKAISIDENRVGIEARQRIERVAGDRVGGPH